MTISRQSLLLAVAAASLAAAGSAGAQRANANAPARATKAGKATTAANVANVANAAKTAPAPAASAAAAFQIDPVHSEVGFRIRHLLSKVRGTFGAWTGTIALDTTNLANSSVDVAIKTASIDTREPKRDAHLRSNDFFAADSFPTITFKSNKVTKVGSTLKIAGDLTIRGRTKPVVLTGSYLGAGKDPWGKQRAAFEASTTINRQDFGVSWNSPADNGAMLGDDVEITIAVEAVKQ